MTSPWWLQALFDQMDIPMRTNALRPDPLRPVDAVFRLVPENYDLSPNFEDRITREYYIRSKFGHIEANPHRDDSTISITNVYVTLDQDSNKNTYAPNVVNANIEHLLQFITDIARIAKQAGDINRATAHDPTQASRELGRAQHILLYGPRGCGKTFLLNYLLSEFSKTFDDDKLLWIRINLNEDFGEPNVYPEKPKDDYQHILHHYILAQLTKIVFRYYDPTSEFYKYKPHPIEISQILRDQYADNTGNQTSMDEYRTIVSNIQESFARKMQDPPISPSLIPFWIGLRTHGLVLKEGYSVVAILDNLDRLEADAAHRNRFRAIFRAASQLVTSGLGSLGMAVVSVTRDDTLRRIEAMNRPLAHPFLQGQTIRWKVEPPPLEKVLDKRIAFLEKRIPSIAGTHQWDMADWCKHLTVVKACATEMRQNGGADILLFGDNRRAQMQTMQLRYENALRATNYLLIEDLILAGQRYPPKVYRYEATQKGSHLRFERLGNSRFDNHLLPSIFEYPLAVGFTPQNGESVHSEGILQGLRILQLVAATERLHNDRFEYILENEVKQILHVIFDYSSETTGILLEQFREYEILRRTNDIGIGMPLGSSEARRVRLARKGISILEYYIYQLAYLGLWAMRIPLRDAKNDDAPGFFIAASLDDGGRRGVGVQHSMSEELVTWVGTKAINATGMVKAIRSMNAIQHRRYEHEMGRGRIRNERGKMILSEAVKGSEEVAGMFVCADQIAARVKGQMDAMVRSVTDKNSAGEERLRLMVEEWIRRWE